MATEDFSFPIIMDDFPCTIDSPPLWHLSPAASPNSCQEEPAATRGKGNKEEDEEDCFASEPTRNIQRKSFSCVHGKEDDHEEEKMDMLWEDFNEELARSTSSARSSTSSSRDMVELGCVKGLTTSKNNGAGALSTKKPGMAVIVKLVLKKLFLLQSSHRRLKIKGPHGGQ